MMELFQAGLECSPVPKPFFPQKHHDIPACSQIMSLLCQGKHRLVTSPSSDKCREQAGHCQTSPWEGRREETSLGDNFGRKHVSCFFHPAFTA